MSTSTPSLGIDHPTVVPTNFVPECRDGEELDGDGSNATAAADAETAADDADS